MATVLAVGNSEGERRCDAKCHDAKAPECDCICGGMFHGSKAAGGIRELGNRVEQYYTEVIEHVKLSGGHVQLALETMLKGAGNANG